MERRAFAVLLALCLLMLPSAAAARRHHLRRVSASESLTDIRSFGAKCDGSDAAPAIRSAIATGAKHIVIPACAQPYTVASFDPQVWPVDRSARMMFWLQAGQLIEFVGNAQLKVGTTVFPGSGGYAVFFADQRNNVTIKNIDIDMNGANNLAPTAAYYPAFPIYFDGGEYNSVLGGQIIDAPGHNAVVTGGELRGVHSSHFTVRDVVVRNGGTTLPGNVNDKDWSAFYSDATYTTFDRNQVLADGPPAYVINAGGFEIHNSNSVATNNTCRYTFPCVYITRSVDGPDTTDVEVSRNNMLDVVQGISFFLPGTNTNFGRIRITDNTVTLKKNPHFPSQTPWFVSMPRDDRAIYSKLTTLYDSEFSGNKITGDPAEPNSIAFRLAGVSNVTVENNEVRDATVVVLNQNPRGARNVKVRGNATSGRASRSRVVVTYDTPGAAPPVRAPGTAYVLHQYVRPSVPNGFTYEVTVAGTTADGGDPHWPTTIGAQVRDGSVTFTCRPGWRVDGLDETPE